MAAAPGFWWPGRPRPRVEGDRNGVRRHWCDVDVGSLFSTPEEGLARPPTTTCTWWACPRLAAGHLTLVPTLRDALAEVGRPDVMIVVGGVIPPGDFDELYAAGAAAILPARDRDRRGCDRLAEQARRTVGLQPKLDGDRCRQGRQFRRRVSRVHSRR
ncbi:hypothetical protein [Mycobacterium tilburgii]|uniref:hypothetical protein n=1 Tax=Mycobacterium tilburgii TaxID=44467 RepID=UPI001182F1ED